MIFEIIRGGKNWLGGERMGRPIFSPRGKNWLGENSGLLHRYDFAVESRCDVHCIICSKH